MPAEHLEQRRFAGAVGADDADALVGRDQPVEVFEEDFGAEAFSGPGELNHWGLGIIVAWVSDEKGSGTRGPTCRVPEPHDREKEMFEACHYERRGARAPVIASIATGRSTT